jgi:hypothetical protein
MAGTLFLLAYPVQGKFPEEPGFYFFMLPSYCIFIPVINESNPPAG